MKKFTLTFSCYTYNALTQVSENGVVSFRNAFASIQSNPGFPLSSADVIIAPFWDDSNVEISGQTFYRFSENRTLLDHVESLINERSFTPSSLFIATWDRVAEFGGITNVVRHTATVTIIIQRQIGRTIV